MSYLAIDPGIRGTGLALFEYGEMYPVKVSNVCPVQSDPWENRLHYVCTLVEEFIMKNRPADCYIEQPAFMGSTREGIMCARNGDLVKLCFLAGAIYWVCSGANCKMFLVTPQQWKWRTKKSDAHIVLRKKLPLLKNRKYTEHELDAIGIGLYAGALERK